MQRFMDRGILPNFKKLHGESECHVTEAKEKPPYLEPWIQWINVHSGVDYDEHQIFNLDEGHLAKAPALWDVLSKAGYRTWVCGSMNPRVDADYTGAILPDPWTTKVAPQPAELGVFMKFVQKNVQEYTKDKVPLTKREYAEFLTYMARHGLSARTGMAVARQLLDEKRTKGKSRWRRQSILDRLQMDVFKHYWKSLNPHFATFFSNSTAHLQHMHWREMEPGLFKVAPSTKEMAEYSDAIEWGYRLQDALLGELFELAGPDTTLIFLTALSQQPCTVYEEQGGKVAFRPREFEKLLAWAGVTGNYTVAPVMTQYFHVDFDSESAAGAGAEKLRALSAAGTHALHVDHNGKQLFVGCRIYKKLGESEQLTSSATGKSAPFFDMLYQIEGMKSGMHHPDGMLWIRTPSHRHVVHSAKVPLERLAPMILDMFKVAKPATMRQQPLEVGVSA